jgi:hypothetical protein
LDKIKESFSQKNIGIPVHYPNNSFKFNQFYYSPLLTDPSLYYQPFEQQNTIPQQWTIPYYSPMYI